MTMHILDGGIADVFRIMLWYPYRWGVSFMPPARELELSRQVGHLLAWLEPGEVSRAIANLGRAFPLRTDLRAVAIECLERRIENEYLSLSFEKLDRETLPSYLEFAGLDRIDGVLREGRGCILAYPHFGPVMLPLFGLGLLGYELAQISAREAPESSSAAALAAFRIRRHLEDLVPAAIIDARSYLRPTLRRLKQGETVMIAYDGSGGGEEVGRRVPVTLLGQRVLLPVGALYLALRSGAPLMPMILTPGRGGAAYRAVIGPALELEHHGDVRETLRHNAQRIAMILEGHLLRYPGCWHLWPEFEPGRMIVGGSAVG
jgi:KDO2-lipid IV(A) lauroyltransferase